MVESLRLFRKPLLRKMSSLLTGEKRMLVKSHEQNFIWNIFSVASDSSECAPLISAILPVSVCLELIEGIEQFARVLFGASHLTEFSFSDEAQLAFMW